MRDEQQEQECRTRDSGVRVRKGSVVGEAMASGEVLLQPPRQCQIHFHSLLPMRGSAVKEWSQVLLRTSDLQGDCSPGASTTWTNTHTASLLHRVRGGLPGNYEGTHFPPLQWRARSSKLSAAPERPFHFCHGISAKKTTFGAVSCEVGTKRTG